MAGLQPIDDLGIVQWLLRARDSGASGVLTVRPPLQEAIHVTLVGGCVRHIAPDLDVLSGAGDDPGALASALEVGRDMVNERMKALGELRDGDFSFVDDPSAASVNSGTGLPLDVDPAPGLFRSFDHTQCDGEQAAVLGRRWDERLRPGPQHAVRIDAFRAAWPEDSVHGAIDRAQSITELVGGAPDALTLLRRVYAAMSVGVAVLVDTAAAVAPSAGQANASVRVEPDLQAQMEAQMEAQLAEAARASTPAPSIAEVPWNVEDDLVLTSPTVSTASPEKGASISGALSVAQLVEAAEIEGDPWIGVSAYPDVAERVVRRDARIRAGRTEERRTRSGVSQLIRPESEDVGLNLDLMDEDRTSTANLLSKASESVRVPSPSQPSMRDLTPPPVEPAEVADAPAVEAAPRVLSTPEGTPAANPRVLTAPGSAPAAGPRVLTGPGQTGPGQTSPDQTGPGQTGPGQTGPDQTAPEPGAAPASPAPRAVLTTPPPSNVEEIRTPSTAVTAAAPSAPAASSPKPEVDEDGLTESETERITALNEWLDQVTPPLEAEDLYKAFGVAPDIDSDNLLLKHRELVIKFHSDRFERFDIGDATERLVVVWGKLNKGIVTLTDPAERAEYDLYLDRKKRGLPTDPVVVMRAESIYLDGDALLNAGKFQDALAKFDEAISMNGADPEFHVARSWARVQIAATAPGANGVAPPKLRDRARDACNAALKDIPRLARAHYYLGLLAKMDGNAGGARAAFSRAIELNPDYVEAKREIRLLDMRGGTGEPTPAAATVEQEEKGGLFGRFRKP